MPTSATAIPPAVTRLLAARYPTLCIDRTWLEESIDRLRSSDPTLRTAADDQLAKAVRQELLNSDLAEVVSPGHRVFTTQLSNAKDGKVGDVGRGAVLVQIERMIDIGYSRSAQLDIAESRRDAKSSLDPDLTQLKDDGDKMNGEDTDPMAEFQASEEEKLQSTTVFPRRMIKLELSDGSEAGRMFGIELQRLPGLDMNSTKVGAKLLLRGVTVRDGYLLLTPKTTSVEGGSVERKAATADTIFINSLREALGKPLLPAQSDQASVQTQQMGSARDAPVQVPASLPRVKSGSTTREAPTRTDEFDSMDDSVNDDSFLLAAINAEAEILASEAPPSNPANTATASAPEKSRKNLYVPNSLKPKSPKSSPRNQVVENAPMKAEEPIILSDSDDDEIFAQVQDPSVPPPHSTREDAIVIDSSPEPE